jgi:DNA-binding response OmpR family regulator
LDPQGAIFKLNDYSPNSFAVRTPERPVVCKVLVVEDEALQGLNVMATLSRAGIEAVGPYPTVSGAFAAIEERTFDAALVDINLNGVPSFDVAATLRQKGIPFAFVTAYERTLPEEFRSVPVISKPYDEQELLSVACGLLGMAQPKGPTPRNHTTVPDR